MKKLFSFFLAILMIVTVGQSAYAIDISAEVDFDIAASEYTLDMTPQLSYIVYGFTSLDSNAPDEFKETSQYVENYTIEFVYPGDKDTQRSLKSNVIMSGTIDIMNEDSITIPVSGISRLNTTEIELPLLSNELKKEISSLSEDGIKSVLRNISVNVFYARPDYNELASMNDDGYFEGTSSSTMLVQKSSIAEDMVLNGSAQQNFHRMYAAIYAYDEYNGQFKRQSFSAYHAKYNSLNQLVDGLAYVSTFQNDNRPDVISLGWSLGGAIDINDSSIDLQCNYNLQCENCYLQGRTNYGYSNFNKYSPDVSLHSSLFTGQSLGFNFPDFGISNCSYCWSTIPTRPAVMNMYARSGWYLIGSYNGANGVVRTEYHHTYRGLSLTLSPTISIPFSISFTPNLVENLDFERTWVYTTISPW